MRGESGGEGGGICFVRVADEGGVVARILADIDAGRRSEGPHWIHGKPKRARAAYHYFYDATRPGLMAEHPDCTLSEMSKLVSAAWKDTPDEEKEAYRAMAAPDQERYGRDLLRMEESRHVVAPDPVG
ncbi:hypothetical protein THAOC_14685, partial [Thalassiosira oceanica]